MGVTVTASRAERSRVGSKPKTVTSAALRGHVARSTTRTSRPGRGQHGPVLGQVPSGRGTGAGATLTATTGGDGSLASAVRRRESQSSRHFGAGRCSSSGSHSTQTQTADSDHVERCGRNSAAEAAVCPKEDVGDFSGRLLAEIARYSAARNRLMGLRTGGDATSKGAGQTFHEAEETLLQALDSERSCPVESTTGRCPKLDPRFVAWQNLLHQQPSLDREGGRGQDVARYHGASVWASAGPRFVEHVNHGGQRAAEELGRVRQGSEEWGHTERLQHSLLMLLDELEGRRAVAANEERGWRSTTAAHGWSGGNAEGDDDDSSLRLFEDWYCWNKVGGTVGAPTLDWHGTLLRFRGRGRLGELLQFAVGT